MDGDMVDPPEKKRDLDDDSPDGTMSSGEATDHDAAGASGEVDDFEAIIGDLDYSDVDVPALLAEREATDTAILDWAGALPRDWLASAVEYRAAADGRLRRLPAWVAATHLFQHATHHRGQVTALLKQEGKDIGATDLPWLPGVVRRTD